MTALTTLGIAIALLLAISAARDWHRHRSANRRLRQIMRQVEQHERRQHALRRINDGR